jgi:hypothetical protein
MMQMLFSESRLPRPISEMGPWDFWSDPFALNLTMEEAQAIYDGTADGELQARAHELCLCARNHLMSAMGPQDMNPNFRWFS